MRHSFSKFFSPLIILIAVSSAALADKPIVLTGLDPILLIGGKEVKGKDSISTEYGKYRYLFDSEEDKAKFLVSPKESAVQNEDWCFIHPKMRAIPDYFGVYKNHIYLFGSIAMRRNFKAHPEMAVAMSKGMGARNTGAPNVGILIFPGCQTVDVNGPYDMMVHAKLNVVLVSEHASPISSNTGFTYTPDCSFENCPKLDAIIVPGGFVPYKGDEDCAEANWVRERTKDCKYVMSVCNGALLLTIAGALDGKTATSTHMMLDFWEKDAPKIKVVRDKRYVQDGNVITTGTGTAGMDGTLRLIELLDSRASAEAAALEEEYFWDPSNSYIRGSLAEPLLRKAIGPGFTLPEGVKTQLNELHGDSKQWLRQWKVSGDKISNADVLKALDNRLGKSWTSVKTTDSSIEYSFKDEKGRTWKGLLSIEADPEDKVGELLTIQINLK